MIPYIFSNRYIDGNDSNFHISNIFSIYTGMKQGTTKSEKDLYFELKTMLVNICESLVNTKINFVEFASLVQTSNPKFDIDEVISEDDPEYNDVK